jgi:hypothetical protein
MKTDEPLPKTILQALDINEFSEGNERGSNMGCLFVLISGASPRIGLFIFWLLRPNRVDAAFDTFILPLLGIIFAPMATLLYAILHTPGVGLGAWEWFWVIVALVFDLGHTATGFAARNQVRPQRAQPGPVA